MVKLIRLEKQFILNFLSNSLGGPGPAEIVGLVFNGSTVEELFPVDLDAFFAHGELLIISQVVCSDESRDK